MPDGPESAQSREGLFAEHRAYLFAVAYRLLGTAADAEDILQDAWIRFSAACADEIRHPRSYLVTIVTRLCLDVLKSARRRREEYVGVWLPEPVSTREALGNDLLEETESASFAFLLLLERLTPMQRAVLVLHDVFDDSHEEVARTIGCTVASSRQTLRRARLRLGATAPPKSPPTEEARDMAEKFLAATRTGDVEALLRALAPDVVLMSDGGGKVAAINRPLAGSSSVGRFLAGVSRQAGPSRVVVTELNAQPAILVFENEALTNAFLFDVSSAGITAIYVVRNPEKLKRLAGTSQKEFDQGQPPTPAR